MGLEEQRIFEALLRRMEAVVMCEQSARDFVKAAKAALNDLKANDSEPK